MTNGGQRQSGNGWSLYEKKILSDIERLEQNQQRLYQTQQDHSVQLATLFARISMLAASVAAGTSVAFRLLPDIL